MNTSAAETFDPKIFQLLFQAEEKHFWFRARTRVIAELARRATKELPTGYRVLEIGCGTGNVLRTLEKVCTKGEITGIDAYEEALQFARSRITRSRLIAGDVFSEQGFQFDERFDVIGMFDVLEHLPDDAAALKRVSGLLKPGGVLLLTVPGHQSLWSYFDVISHHQRRYGRPDLAGKLSASGFRLDYISDYFSLLLPLMWLARHGKVPPESLDSSEIERRVNREFRRIPVLNEVLVGLFALEAKLVGWGRRIPFGASILVSARKVLDAPSLHV